MLGLYALAVMNREGRLYGYELAERIALRTDGTWRPGPGAIYPALAALTDRGFARSRLEHRRRVYDVTPSGRAYLRRFRQQMLWRNRGGPDLGALWAEIAGHADPGTFRLERLQRQVDSLIDFLARAEESGRDPRPLRDQMRAVLRQAEGRLGPEEAASSPPRARRP